ncbi:MAG: STAS domain-containing protein [Thermoanaerobaculia bacterium]
MEIEIIPRETATVVAIRGSIDGLTASDVLASFGAEIGAGRIRLVADLGGVEFLSSAGLRAVLATVKDARQRGGDFRLAAVRPDVWKVLNLSGFTSIVKIFPDVDSALASFEP